MLLLCLLSKTVYANNTEILENYCKKGNDYYYQPTYAFDNLCFIFKTIPAFPEYIDGWLGKKINWFLRPSSKYDPFSAPIYVFDIYEYKNILPAYHYENQRGLGDVYLFITHDKENIKKQKYIEFNDRIKYVINPHQVFNVLTKDTYFDADIVIDDIYIYVYAYRVKNNDIINKIISNINLDLIKQIR